MKIPKLAISLGEPAGIGPDLLLLAAQHKINAQLVVFADPDLLQHRAKLLGLNLDFTVVSSISEIKKLSTNKIAIKPVPLAKGVIAGKLLQENSPMVIDALKQASMAVLNKQLDALITAPIHKAIINQVGIKFQGHTEYLAQLSGLKSNQVVMSFIYQNLCLALVTTHLPLKQVSEAIYSGKLLSTLEIINQSYRNLFKIDKAKIMVCGLNPHAGENGYLGTEELDIIQPTIESLQQKGLNIAGPIAADHAYQVAKKNKYDVLVSMYHDQVLPVLKNIAEFKAVNLTLGLPFIRSSVDHGVALDLAGTTLASPASLLAAINLAIKLVNK